MTNQLNEFLEKVESDLELQQKLQSINTPSDAVAMAKDCGFTLSEQDFILAMEDAELDNAAGGIRGVARAFRFNNRNSNLRNAL